MKTRILLFISTLILVGCGNAFGEEAVSQANTPAKGQMIVYSTPDLLKLTSAWAEHYGKINPGISIEVIGVPDVTAALGDEGTLGFMTGEGQTAGQGANFWKMGVARDVVVPIANSDNPFQESLLQRGVSSSSLAGIFNDPDKQVWNTLLENGEQAQVHIYIMNDISVIKSIERFLGLEKLPVEGVKLLSGEELITAVQNDPNAIGFSKLVNIVNPEGQGLAGGIRMVPVDKNGNGRIDYQESIYEDLNVFARGVWIGKYPRALYSEIYSVSVAQPESGMAVAFLNWVLTDGQALLYQNGFSDLVYSEKQSKIDKINNMPVYSPPVQEYNTAARLVIVIISAFILAGVVLSYAVRYNRKKKVLVSFSSPDSIKWFDEKSITAPGGLFFDKTHTWTFMEKDGTVKIGIDDFLQHVTGPITRIEMKEPGDRIEKGEPFLSLVQKGKQLKIYSPVSGIIIQENRRLYNNASSVNASPFSDGWIYVVEPANWLKDTRMLMMADKYIKWLPEEFARLKDFLALALNPERPRYAKMVLQDGGILKDHILADLGPEVWEDFQTDFMDIYK